jgi:hypothetical protein
MASAERIRQKEFDKRDPTDGWIQNDDKRYE